MGIHFAAGVNLSSSRGIRLGRKIGGSGGDPLAGIPLDLRLQTHSGLGATPDAPIGMYQNYFAGAKFLMPTLNPALLAEFTVNIDGGVSVAVYSFALVNPGDGSNYVGIASGNPVTDAASLSAAINIAQGTDCTSSSDGSGNVVITSVQIGGTTSVVVSGDATASNNFPSVAGVPAATTAGDPVALTLDAISNQGYLTAQPDATAQGVLAFESGVPKITFDGVNDWLPLVAPALGGQVTYSALFKSNTAAWNNYWGLLNQSSAFSTEAERWPCFDGGGASTSFYNNASIPDAVSRDGVVLAPNYNLAPIDQWMVVTIETNSASSPEPRGIGQMHGLTAFGFYGSFDLIALLLYSGTPSPADVATVEAYFQTLKP